MELTKYQKKIIKKAKKRLRRKNYLMSMPTGAGKSMSISKAI